MIEAMKFLPFAALAIWCATLVALPLMMRSGRHLPHRDRNHRILIHYGYITLATPAGVVTILAGTALIFLVPVYEPWLLVKLALVAGMVGVHRWLGDLIMKSGEDPRPAAKARPLIGLFLAIPLMAGVLWLVLAKPDLDVIEAWLPQWLLQPQGSGS